ncbi:hypothetical protein [Noviherbaspirillum sp.]|uniref:hypothetical protein n=1 Tax=Noviherbaspirillum sp. TaxID=1926288 RepID=UPI002D44E96B|nr:hypothetical protein [Noviherbaspirillum sp.]HZW23146.1 hypothetical protein [Noviherbaspirillum sp.]
MAAGVTRSARHWRPAALLLSVACHLALGYTVATSTMPAHGLPLEAPPLKVLPVVLKPATESPQAPPEAARPAARQAPLPSAPVHEDVPIVQPTGPYYFRLSELTEKPAILQDTATDMVVRVPGLPPQAAILKLLINDEGEVDRVVVEDSFLADEVEQQIAETFNKLRFRPGMIGRIAVRSQLRIEVQLESIEQRRVTMGANG